MKTKRFMRQMVLFPVIIMLSIIMVPILAQAQTEGCPVDMTHYWKLNEDTGTIYTDLYDTHATCTNCPSSTPGIIDGAQQFNGNRVRVADDDTFDWVSTDSFSIEVWMKKDTPCPVSEVIIGRAYKDTNHWWLGCKKDCRAFFHLGDTSGDGVSLRGPYINDGGWHHLVAVRDNTVGMNLLYVDGVKVDSEIKGYSKGFDFQTNLNIGWLNYGGGFQFNGIIDEVALYNRALSHYEILQHYNDGLSGLSSGYCICLPICAPVLPQITSIPPDKIIVNRLYTYDVESLDYPAATYELIEYPGGMVINSYTGIITWTPVPGQEGDHQIEVKATNEAGNDTQIFTLHVENEPTTCPVGIISYWNLDENVGPHYYDSYNSNYGSCTDGECPVSLAAKVNNGQQFDGDGTEIDIPSRELYNWRSTDSFSIEAWTKKSTSCSGNEVIIGREFRSDKHWWLGCYGDGRALFFLGDKTGDGLILLGPVITDGNWHHLVAIRDNSTGKNLLYVDGVKVASGNKDYSAHFNFNTSLNIGWLDLAHEYHYEGIIDEVALYNRVLSIPEIQQHYVYGSSGIGYCETVAPSIISTPVTAAIAGEPYTYDVDAMGNPAPTYSLVTSPGGMKINSTTGLIQWMPSNAGTFDVSVQASNGIGTPDTQNFTIVVGGFTSVQVLSPNGGEKIPSGSNYLISWGAPREAEKFKLKYSLDNGLTWIPIPKTADFINVKSYDWIVPKPWGNKKKCLVKVKGYNSSGVKIGDPGTSDAPFTIEVVKLTSPNGGETLTSNTIPTDPITWTTNATKNPPVAKVKLYYSKNGGITWILITELTGDPGSFGDWLVPVVTKEKTNCKVKVELKDENGNVLGQDVSDGYFKIQPAP